MFDSKLKKESQELYLKVMDALRRTNKDLIDINNWLRKAIDTAVRFKTNDCNIYIKKFIEFRCSYQARRDEYIRMIWGTDFPLIRFKSK